MSTPIAEPTTDARYPIGRFDFDMVVAPADRPRLIEEIASLPAKLRATVQGTTEQHLTHTYRPGGWTVRQLVHHVPDSHMNGFVRLKLALTEDRPTVSAYDEKKFAALADMKLPVAVSLELVRSLHARWLAIYGTMKDDDWQRMFVHPEYTDPLTLDWQVQMYGWHSRHHVAHITALRQREGW